MEEKKTSPEKVSAEGLVASDTDASSSNSADENSKIKELRLRLRRLPSAAMKLMREYKRDARMHIKESAVGLVLGLCAYLLGSCRLLFGTSPLGLALLCATPKKILWIFAGLSLSALSLPEAPVIHIFAYATAVTVRILARLLVDVPAESEGSLRGTKEVKLRASAVFTESIYLRMATGAAAAFVVGIFNIISNAFEYYSLFGAIFSILSVPAAVFVYAGCFEENKCDARFRELAIGALLVSVTFAVRDMKLIGISVGAFFAFFVTLYVCRSSGILRGVLIGLASGFAYSPEYSPMFALAAVTVGALWNLSAFGALVAGGTAAMLWGFYVEGVAAMGTVLPAVMLASVCYMGARRLTLFPAAKDLLFSGRYARDMNDAEAARESRERTNDRLSELSDTFSSLSEIFYNLSDRLSRPALPEIRRMCDGVYDKYCPLCPSRELCWELEYSKSRDMLSAISKRIADGGSEDGTDIPEYMKSRCVALPGIIGEINHGFANLCRTSRMADKTEVFAMDYRSVSLLLSEICAENKKDYVMDKELTEKMPDVLSEYGFGEGGVSVYGQRRRQIIARGFDISKGGIGTVELKKSVEKAFGGPVSEPVIELKENIMTLRMSSARRFCAKSTVMTAGAEESVCGDSVATFENCDDKYYALISDGMGTGDGASLTSSICSIFLQKMLGAGNGEYASVRMLNSFIRSKQEECSSTVDLMGLDLLSGRVTFTKCGASLSIVKRGEELFKLSAATLPLGILDKIDAGKLSFDGREGDVIIMISDGVASGDEDCLWLIEMLNSEWDNDLSKMAKKMIARARERGSRDDISVILTRICGEK